MPNDPALICTFPHNDHTCAAYEYTETLAAKIDNVKQSASAFPPISIWRTISQLCTLAQDLVPDAKLRPDNIHYQNSGRMFFRDTSTATQDMTTVINSTSAAFYEAPEMFMRQACSEHSLCWAIGCIAYELAALEPAYFDREESGNVMAVMMSITQGTPPPPLTEAFSDQELSVFITSCLQVQQDQRPTLAHILTLADSKLTQ